MEWCGTECAHLFGATLGGLRPLGGLLGGLQLRLQVLQLARVLLVRLVDGLVDGLGKLHEHSAKLNVVWCGVAWCADLLDGALGPRGLRHNGSLLLLLDLGVLDRSLGLRCATSNGKTVAVAMARATAKAPTRR